MNPGLKPEADYTRPRDPDPRLGDDPKPEKPGNYSHLGELLAIGWNLAISIGIGVALGYYFDKWLGTRPWGLIGFLLLGIVAGFVNLFRTVVRLDRKDNR